MLIMIAFKNMILLSENIRTFIVLVQEKSVTNTAFKLGLTQTAVTQRLKALEESCGATLFLRTRKGLLMTNEGEELYQSALQVQTIESQSISFNKSEQNKTSVFKIACPTSLINTLVIPKIIEFNKKNNNFQISFQIKADDLEDRVSKIKKGLIDFGFIRSSDVPNELEGKIVTSDKFYLIGPTHFKNMNIKEIVSNYRAVNFDIADDLTLAYLKKFKLEKLYNPNPHTINNIPGLVSLIEAGFGYGLIEEKFLKKFLPKNKLSILNNNQFLENKMALCWLPRPIYSKTFLSFIDLISKN